MDKELKFLIGQEVNIKYNLDDDHISYTDIEDDGTAFVYGEDGKTYDIQIDN